MRFALAFALVLLGSLFGRNASAAAYAHSWTWKQRPGDEQLARCIGDMQRLILRRPDLLVVLEPNAAHQLRFTGKGEHGDEFVFPGQVGLNKIATDQKPYDEVVTAALLVARDHFGPDVLEIQSDGTWLQWQDGILLYTETFQRGPKNPGLREGPSFTPGGRMRPAADRWSNPKTRAWGVVIAMCLTGLLVLFFTPTKQG